MRFTKAHVQEACQRAVHKFYIVRRILIICWFVAGIGIGTAIGTYYGPAIIALVNQ